MTSMVRRNTSSYRPDRVCASLAEVARCSPEDAATSGRQGQWLCTESRIACTTVLSGSRCSLLRKCDSRGGHSNRMRRPNSEDSERSPPPVLPARAGSMEQARALLWGELRKRCRMSCNCSVIPPFLELFDSQSYITTALTSLALHRVLTC
jgi:hypothetical protein